MIKRKKILRFVQVHAAAMVATILLALACLYVRHRILNPGIYGAEAYGFVLAILLLQMLTLVFWTPAIKRLIGLDKMR